MLRIGICDDVYDARLVLRATLERALEERHSGAQFFEFSSGEGLLQWLGNHAGELDLVFLDMEMGELDGMETARRLRRTRGSSWCSSPGTPTASLTDTAWGPWGIS